MPQYTVRPGCEHGAGKRYKAGDVVELSEAEAAPFLDKLEPLPAPSERPAEAQPEPSAPGANDASLGEWGGLNDATVQALREGGFADAEAVRAATDEQLQAVRGVGPRAVRNIREALAVPVVPAVLPPLE